MSKQNSSGSDPSDQKTPNPIDDSPNLKSKKKTRELENLHQAERTKKLEELFTREESSVIQESNVNAKDEEPQKKETTSNAPSNETKTSNLRDVDKVFKQRLTVHVPVELAERIKNAVYWTPGLTIAKLAENGLFKALEVIEQENGGPFPPRAEELRGGRPIK